LNSKVKAEACCENFSKMFSIADFDDLSVYLTIIAGYSNYVTITLVIACFLMMTVFIARLHIENGSMTSGTVVSSHIPASAMKGVYNPLSLTLQSGKSSSIKDGVWLSISCHGSVMLQDYWGVEISSVYPAIFDLWSHIEDKFQQDSLFSEISLFRGEQQLINSAEENTTMHFSNIQTADFDLGSVPRSRYPLVLVGIVNDDQILQDDNCIVCNVWFVHLSDSTCPGSSHIISQYVRTRYGQPCCLQQLFMASSEEDEETTKTNTETADETDNTKPSVAGPLPPSCVVCQTARVSRALLPCRHACVCRACFKRLETCPMCRTTITTYFLLEGYTEKEEEEESEADDVVHQDEHGIVAHVLLGLNDTMNAYIGLDTD